MSAPSSGAYTIQLNVPSPAKFLLTLPEAYDDLKVLAASGKSDQIVNMFCCTYE